MNSSFARRAAPLIPYIAVGLGLILAHNAWAALLGYHLGMALVLTLDRRWHLARTLFKGWQASRLLLAAVSGLAAGFVLFALSPLIDLPPALGASLAGLGLTKQAWPAFIIYFSAINPWLEELYWRGYLGSASRGLAAADFWFAGYHPFVLVSYLRWPWLALAFLSLVGVAWIWRQAARLSDGLLVPAVSHLAADASIIVAVYTLSSS